MELSWRRRPQTHIPRGFAASSATALVANLWHFGQKHKKKRRCLKMAKASHERQRLFPQHFWASENRVQKERHSRNYFHKEFPSGMSYKPAGKDDGIFRPLPKRLFWILWCRWRTLRARLNSSHSAATFVLPRSRKRRKSRSCFTYAKLPSA